MNTSGLSDFLYRTLLENFPYSFDDILSNIKSWFVYDPKHPLLFNSSLFLGMFLVFYLVYIFTKKHTYFRTVYVGLFSLFFYYKAGGEYFILLVLSSALNYFLADQIYKREKQQRIKLCFLVISINEPNFVLFMTNKSMKFIKLQNIIVLLCWFNFMLTAM